MTKRRKQQDKELTNAAFNSTKPYFKKLGNGLEYIKDSLQKEQEKREAWEQCIEYENQIRDKHISNSIKDQKELEDKFERTKSELNKIRMQNLVACEYCRTHIPATQVVCHNCGEIQTTFPFCFGEQDVNEKIIDLCTDELAALSYSVKQSINNETNYIYEDIAPKVKIMKKISDISEMRLKVEKDNSKIIFEEIHNRSNDFITNNSNKKIEIAVIGDVKSGKSSLINALLGAKVANVDATPKTSVLVKYVPVSDNSYIKVSFYSQEEWKDNWNSISAKENEALTEYRKSKASTIRANYIGRKPIYTKYPDEKIYAELGKWTTADSPEHFFVKEVEVGYKTDFLPTDVVLVDTPGLNDPVKTRSQITEDYIKKSDCVLICIAYENLSNDAAIELLGKVNDKNKQSLDKALVVLTKRDQNPESDNKKKYGKFIDLTKKLFKTKGSAMNHIVSVCAEPYCYLKMFLNGEKLLKDENRKFKSVIYELDIEENQISEKEEEFIKYTGIEILKGKVKDLIKNRRKDLKQSIENDYKLTINDMEKILTNMRIGKYSELYSVINETDELISKQEDIQILLDDIRKDIEKMKKIKEKIVEKEK